MFWTRHTLFSSSWRKLVSNASNIQTGFLCALTFLFLASLLVKVLVDKVLDFEFDEFNRNLYFPSEIAGYIYSLWKDPVVPKILDELGTNDYYLVDSAPQYALFAISDRIRCIILQLFGWGASNRWPRISSYRKRCLESERGDNGNSRNMVYRYEFIGSLCFLMVTRSHLILI